jgi:hypothetical protein
MIPAVLDVESNVANDVMLDNVRKSIQRPLTWFDFDEVNDVSVCIVGGAPSLEHSYPQIQIRQQNGAKVWAVNGSYEWLKNKGIQPDVHVILDARPENAQFVANPSADVKYLIASQCDDAVFTALEGQNVELCHVHIVGMYELLEGEKNRVVHLLGGFTTVGIFALILAKLKGHRRMFLFGMDSSYTDEAHHAYEQAGNDDENTITAYLNDKSYTLAPWMAQQVYDFQHIAEEFIEEEVVIEVCGSGLLYDVAKSMSN